MPLFAVPTKEEIASAIKAWVNRVYKGDGEAAFRASDTSGSGLLDEDDVCSILKRCDIGCGITRGIIADRIIFALDKDGDRKLSLDELKAYIA